MTGRLLDNERFSEDENPCENSARMPSNDFRQVMLAKRLLHRTMTLSRKKPLAPSGLLLRALLGWDLSTSNKKGEK